MDATKKRKLEHNGAAVPSDNLTSLPSSDNLTSLTPSDTRKILEPFTHDQLLDILQSAAVRHVDVLDAVRSVADRDPTQRKLFVRGLGWDTTSDKLRSLFSAYGDLDEAAVILDKVTGKSKGFAFVTFRHVDGAVLALKEPSKKIDGRMTVSQLANQNSTAGGANANANATVAVSSVADVSRKLYVGNVPYEMTGERLLAHFLSYGEIEEGPLGYDKATGKSKGYALFVYKTAEAARAAIVDPIKMIDGAQLTCKIANPSDGKKGKPPGPVSVPAEAPPQMPGQLPGPGQYGPPGGAYGGYTGGMHGPPPMGHNQMNHQPPPSMGGYGPGGNGPYGGSHYGGPGSGGHSGYGPGAPGGGGLGGIGGVGLGGMGGGGGGLGGMGGGSGGGLGGMGGGSGGGLGGGGRVGSMYGLPPNSGGYNESAHYSLSSSGYGGQHHQPAGTSPAPRGPHGMYHGGPPFY